MDRKLKEPDPQALVVSVSFLALPMSVHHMAPSSLRQPVTHPFYTLKRLAKGSKTGRLDAKDALGPTLTFSTSLSFGRCNIALVFQPVQRGIDCSKRNGSVCSLFQFLANGHSICVIAQTSNGKNDQLLERPEKISTAD